MEKEAETGERINRSEVSREQEKGSETQNTVCPQHSKYITDQDQRKLSWQVSQLSYPPFSLGYAYNSLLLSFTQGVHIYSQTQHAQKSTILSFQNFFSVMLLLFHLTTPSSLHW